MLSDKVYKFLKWFALIAIPACVTFLNFVLPLWGVSAEVTNIVSGTVSALGILIGTLIGVSSRYYYMEEENGEGK